MAIETCQAYSAQEQRALQNVHSRHLADFWPHAIVPQPGVGRIESRTRGLVVTMALETSLCVHLAMAVAKKQPLAHVSKEQVKCLGRPWDDSKTPIFRANY